MDGSTAQLFKALLKVPRRERRAKARDAMKRGNAVEAALWATPIVMSPIEAHFLRHRASVCKNCAYYLGKRKEKR